MRNVGARKCAKMRTVKGLRSLSSLFRLGKGRGTVLLWVNYINLYISGVMLFLEYSSGGMVVGRPVKITLCESIAKNILIKLKYCGNLKLPHKT